MPTLEWIGMRSFNNIDFESPVPAEIVKKKLYENGGTVVIPLLDGKMCEVFASSDKQTFTSNKLASGRNHYVSYEYRVFNTIVDL